MFCNEERTIPNNYIFYAIILSNLENFYVISVFLHFFFLLLLYFNWLTTLQITDYLYSFLAAEVVLI